MSDSADEDLRQIVDSLGYGQRFVALYRQVSLQSAMHLRTTATPPRTGFQVHGVSEALTLIAGARSGLSNLFAAGHELPPQGR